MKLNFIFGSIETISMKYITERVWEKCLSGCWVTVLGGALCMHVKKLHWV